MVNLMANHKSAEKAHTKSKIRQTRNTATLSRIKSHIKRVEVSLREGRSDAVQAEFNKAQSEIQKGVSAGALKINTASRRISKLAQKVKTAVLATFNETPTKPEQRPKA